MDEKDKRIEQMRDALEVLLALEVLEYHDKNWLSNRQFDGKRWSEEKQYIMRKALEA